MVIFLAETAQVLAQTPQSLKPAPDAEAGAQAYADNCARCHGPTGAGDGRDSKRMHPRPRKLSEGVFKFRTTASGTPPTDEDLYETISNGLPGSRMPDFQRLPEDVRWQLVYHVKSLSAAFQDKPEPLAFGKDPGKGANLAKGKELYTQLGCNACHGPQGRGNGPSAATLVDQWGDHIDAANLTQGWSYRSGSSPRDVLVRLMTGLDGTPMPSYAEAVKPEEVWDLAYYVHSIQAEPRWSSKVAAVREELGWDKAPRTDLRLSSTFYRNGEIVPSSVRAVSVQAMYNEKEILFRLTWHDRSESRETPSDAAAVVLLEDPNSRWRSGSLRGWTGKTEPAELLSYEDGEWTALLKRPLPSGKRAGLGVMVWDGGNAEQGRHRSNSNWMELILK
ncbi:MAG: c-type cytochrome [Candidatus Omnitrophota bacterium]|nr:c-type cytochrome [Candidatus Omnitrophota bacterium]